MANHPKSNKKLDLVSPPDTVLVTNEESWSDKEFVAMTNDEADETCFNDDDEDDDNDKEN